MDAGRGLMHGLAPLLRACGHRMLEAHDGLAIGANENGML
jgi:hypothetical protein